LRRRERRERQWPEAANDDRSLGHAAFFLEILVDDAYDVGLLHDQEFRAINLDFRPRPFAEQRAIIFFDL
jgi:hypothetical protein